MNEPGRDLWARCTPSPEQDVEAAAAIRGLRANIDRGRLLDTGEPRVYTVQLLLGKQPGVWHPGVQVVPLPGLFWSRQEATGACLGALATLRQFRPELTVSASWCRHTGLADDQTDPPRTRDGRTWATVWAVFEESADTARGEDTATRPHPAPAQEAVGFAAADTRRWLRSPSQQHPGYSNGEALGVTGESFGPGLGGFLSTVDDVLAADPDGLVRRGDVAHVGLWRIPDGDALDQGALITVDLTNGVRLASLHQDIEDFADRDTRGIPAILSALAHIAAQACQAVDAYQASNPTHQPPPA